MRSSEQGVNAAGPAHAKHILVADDEPAVRGVLRRALEIQGYVVHVAEDGRKAEEIARNEHIDLVITDLWMPVMNGVELIEALNTMDSPAEVIVLSGHIVPATTEKLRGLGVFKVLRKPIDIPEFLKAVRTGVRSDRRGRLAGELSKGLGPRSAGRSAGKALVLVADDDDAVRGLLRDILAGAGYRVEEARDGEEAVEKALAHDVSLVLMDLNMPRMSGQEATEALHRASRDCFIVCMTGECSKRETDAALRAGALSCFRKPFDPHELLAEVQRLELVSSHRKRLAERERTRTGLFARPAPSRGHGRRFRRMVIAAATAVLVAAVAVPIAARWIASAGRAARAAAERIGKAVDSAASAEGYLRRDEQRELTRNRY